jgi:hypothetical protein
VVTSTAGLVLQALFAPALTASLDEAMALQQRIDGLAAGALFAKRMLACAQLIPLLRNLLVLQSNRLVESQEEGAIVAQEARVHAISSHGGKALLVFLLERSELLQPCLRIAEGTALTARGLGGVLLLEAGQLGDFAETLTHRGSPARVRARSGTAGKAESASARFKH